MKDRFTRAIEPRPVVAVDPEPPPVPAKLFWQPLCLTCNGPAEKLYKGSSYCSPCYLEFRRTHNE